jgi:chromosome segregation ATPase
MDQKVASASRGMKLSSKVSSLNGFTQSAVKLRLDPLVKKDVEVVDSLRQQVESLSAALHTADDENKRLQTAILAREQELTRSSRMLTVLSAGQVDSENAVAPSNRTEQLLAADVANKRVIDQLNGQVDFLNEQLARAQEELRQGDAKIRRFDSVKGELVQRLFCALCVF